MQAWIKEKEDSKLIYRKGKVRLLEAGKHLKELFCRMKEEAMLSFEQVRFEKMVAHPRGGIRGPRLECGSGLYTQT